MDGLFCMAGLRTTVVTKSSLHVLSLTQSGNINLQWG